MIASEDPDSDGLHTTTPSAVGGDLRVSLVCPQCSAAGWVSWKNLKRGLRCPQCRCQFLLGPHGKMLSEENLPRVRFACPRCGQSGSIASMYPIHKAECGACKLPLTLGPDRELHGTKEVSAMRRADEALKQKRLSSRQKMQKFTTIFTDDDSHLRKWSVAFAALVMVAALVAGVMAARSVFFYDVDDDVRHFIYTCLSGDWDDARNYVPDDDVTRIEFDRWRMYYFTSILDEYRPRDDRVSVLVEPVSETRQSCVVQVTMKSRVIGTRTHREHWIKQDDRWRFDVLATLHELDTVQKQR